ncbi:DUF3718 domain-containing protein [Aliikangiella coralliicola]|uniref:DUF3718 domain-containing protein n=1 Tax=Aliikangiella coralliicola TaxID=2592383 RepID=A0A545TW67_9GAMM|nr:DUF3718 domain-containing protein [Aliikangiella coralliicola]TQV81455.1 DUF3718 domain-containing protein [Aliikangiella coralliicola]
MKAKNSKLSTTFKSALFSVVAMSAISFSNVTQANDVERLVASLCEAAKSDDRSGMRKKLKSAKLRLRNIYDGIHCGPMGSLLRVATKSGSIEAATFIATKIGKKNLAAAESDGKTIVQYTEELVAAGDSSKQAFVDLYNSKL